MSALQPAMVTLNCLVYGDEPAFRRILTVKISPDEAIGELRQKIWKQNPEWQTALNPNRLTLYAPKTPIPTVSKEEFNRAFEKLNFGTPDGRDSVLDELNPTKDVEEYPGLKEAAKKRLHVIVFLPAGKCR